MDYSDSYRPDEEIHVKKAEYCRNCSSVTHKTCDCEIQRPSSELKGNLSGKVLAVKWSILNRLRPDRFSDILSCQLIGQCIQTEDTVNDLQIVQFGDLAIPTKDIIAKSDNFEITIPKTELEKPGRVVLVVYMQLELSGLGLKSNPPRIGTVEFVERAPELFRIGLVTLPGVFKELRTVLEKAKNRGELLLRLAPMSSTKLVKLFSVTFTDVLKGRPTKPVILHCHPAVASQFSPFLKFRPFERKSQRFQQIVSCCGIDAVDHPGNVHLFQAEKLNNSQRVAVKSVLNDCGIFAIFGPPGTGKTRVIASIALNLLFHDERVHPDKRNDSDSKKPDFRQYGPLVIAAPSNKAVDEVGIKLSAEFMPDSTIVLWFAGLGLSNPNRVQTIASWMLTQHARDYFCFENRHHIEENAARLAQLPFYDGKHSWLEIYNQCIDEYCHQPRGRLSRRTDFYMRNEQNMRMVDILLITTAQCMKPVVLSLQSRSLIIDEAGMVAKAVGIALSFRTWEIVKGATPPTTTRDRVVLVGDPHQLQPVVLNSAPLTTDELSISILDTAIGTGCPLLPLTEQHRMHPDISKSPS